MSFTAIVVGIGAIVSLIAIAVSQAAGTSRDVIRAKYGKELHNVAKKIQPALNANENLRTQINTALQNQNSKLAADLLMASPLSSVIRKITAQIKVNEQGIEDTDKHFNEQKELAESTGKDAQKIDEALNGDIASATEGKHAWTGQTGDRIKDNVNKLEQTHADTLKKLEEAKKRNHVPSMNQATPGSGSNIGTINRNTTSSVPSLTMKGNN